MSVRQVVPRPQNQGTAGKVKGQKQHGISTRGSREGEVTWQRVQGRVSAKPGCPRICKEFQPACDFICTVYMYTFNVI